MTRAVSPAVGIPLLVGLTVALAVAVGGVAFGVSSPDPAPPVALSVSASAADDRLTLVHEGGPPLDVRRIDLRVEIDGTPLTHQPPVPFFAASGFRAGPTGPFNPASDPTWSVGERASLRLADTNAPSLSPGATVTVRVFRGEVAVATLEARAS